jgi:NAD(P)H-dependent FMN reductase
MAQPLYIPVLLGTAREGRKSDTVARFVLQELQKQKGVTTELVDVRDYQLGATLRHPKEQHLVELGKTFERADGYVIVAPVYNHGYPGELKMMLDIFYDEYKRKPVSICSTTTGGTGGVQMVEQLRLVAIEFQMVPTRNAVYFSGINSLFDEHGNSTDPLYAERLQALFDELLWYAHALKQAREQPS